jgi:hypothetical protein
MLALIALALLGSPQSSTPAPGTYRVGDAILCLPRARLRAAVERQLVVEGARIVEELPALGLLRVDLPRDDPEQTLVRLRALPGVAWAEWNGLGEGGEVPNDTFFDRQWALDNTGQTGGTPGADIDALRGWDLARGSAGVLVAVLDSGLDPAHVEFVGRTEPGYDFVNDDAEPLDDQGHGTKVSGILAANADNAFGIAGVDGHCTLLPVKVLDGSNHGTTFDLAQGLTYAADAGARVVSMSLINYPATQAVRDALQYAREAGCILVACAGNGGIGDADESFPGNSPLTISVGATGHNDGRATFSGTGASLDLVAPGLSVPATSRSPQDRIAAFSGCSAATPFVSGIVAVALSVDPGMTHEEALALLVTGAEDQVGPSSTDLPGWDDRYGHGRVNLFLSLCALDAGGPTIGAPDEIRIECDRPGGLTGDDPRVVAALEAVSAFDDLDPRPALALDVPAFLPLGSAVRVAALATDACGNESRRDVAVRAVDTVPPALDLAVVPTLLGRRDGALVPLSLAARASDLCDRAPEIELTVYSDEPAAGRGEQDVRFGREGEVALRDERSRAGNGRVYLLIARAIDDSGNGSTRCTAVVVPFDDTPRALESVLAEARAAVQTCEGSGAPPAGFAKQGSVVLPKAPSASRRAAR